MRDAEVPTSSHFVLWGFRWSPRGGATSARRAAFRPAPPATAAGREIPVGILAPVDKHTIAYAACSADTRFELVSVFITLRRLMYKTA